MFQFVTSEPLLDELERIAVKKFGVAAPQARRQRLRVARSADVIFIRTVVTRFPAGHGDNAVLATALDGRAEYIVTGDAKHLLPLGSIKSCRIVTPRQFATILSGG